MNPTKEYMLKHAKQRISELESDIADPVFDKWKEELKNDLKRWKEFVKQESK